MAIKTIQNTNEDAAQAHICSWCLQNCLIPVAVPNGFNLNGIMGFIKANGLSIKTLNEINSRQIKLLKKEGLHTGFPDLMVFGLSNNGQNILFMENKVKNNKPSEIQLACHEWLRSLGFIVEISKDSIDAIRKIKSFFKDTVEEENLTYIEKRKQILDKNGQNIRTSQ